MSPSFITRLLSVSTVLAFPSTALQILEEGQSRGDLTLPASTQGLAMTLPANLSTISNDIDNRLTVRCDGASGSGLSVRSCGNVLALSPTSLEMESWGYLDELPAGTVVDEDLPITLWSGKERGIALMELLACGIPHPC